MTYLLIFSTILGVVGVIGLLAWAMRKVHTQTLKKQYKKKYEDVNKKLDQIHEEISKFGDELKKRIDRFTEKRDYYEILGDQDEVKTYQYMIENEKFYAMATLMTFEQQAASLNVERLMMSALLN